MMMRSFCASPLEQLIVVAGLHTPKSFRSLGRADNTGHFAASNIFVYLLGKRGQSVWQKFPEAKAACVDARHPHQTRDRSSRVVMEFCKTYFWVHVMSEKIRYVECSGHTDSTGLL